MIQRVRRKVYSWVQPFAVAICVASLTAAVSTIWYHQQRLIELDRDNDHISLQLYRQQVRNFEILEGFFRSRIQLIELRRGDDGRLMKTDQAELNYYHQMKESIIIMKENFVVENGRGD
jgi:hypothetical protein